jgi:hypothetical protein
MKKNLPLRTQELLKQLGTVSAFARQATKGEYNSASRIKLKAFIISNKDSYKLIHGITYNLKKNCFVIHFYDENVNCTNTEF